MAPVLYCMAIQPSLDGIKTQFPNLDINSWYLDDGNLVGSIEDISRVLKYIDEVVNFFNSAPVIFDNKYGKIK